MKQFNFNFFFFANLYLSECYQVFFIMYLRGSWAEIHCTVKLGYNKLGYNKPSVKKLGYNKLGYNKLGYNKPGYNKLGYNKPPVIMYKFFNP
jgi:hypothetical protein